MAVAPDLNLMISAKLCLNYFAADRRRCLLPATSIGPLWPIDVVITRNAGFQPDVFAKVPAHSFRKYFFPPVAVLRHRRIGIFFFQSGDVRIGLFIGCVNTSRRGVEETR